MSAPFLHMRELTEVEIIKVRRIARAGQTPEDAMAALGIDRLARNFRDTMRRRYGINFRPSRNMAHAGDPTTIGCGGGIYRIKEIDG